MIRKTPTPSPIEADDIVAEIMNRWPQTAAVFIARRMACPGCAMAPFMSVRDAARSYETDVEALLRDLRAALREPLPLRL